MEVLGLTPVDSALSWWGLNVSQALTEAFFSNTHLGLVAFSIGFFWSIWEMTKKGSYQPFLIFIFISICGILLLIFPKRQEPIEYKSKMEQMGEVSINAKTLKNSQTSLHTVPVVLSFMAQGVDGIIADAINIIDLSLSDSKKFLRNPFGLQKLSLEANQYLYAPISNTELQGDVEDFIYAQYTPSLLIDKNDAHVFEGKEAFKNSLLTMRGSPWVKVQDFLKQMGSASDVVQNNIVLSIIHGQMHQVQSSFIWPLSCAIYNFFPYILGWANFCLYASFPVLMLALIIFRRFNIFLRYAEAFIWIKSWVLTAAMAHHGSLIMAYMQAQFSNEPNWFWEYPYYSFMAAFLLCLMPLLSLIGIHKCFQSINNRF